MRVRVGVDGAGRFGRQLLRTIADRHEPDFEVVALRDAAPAADIGRRLLHDSTHGRWDHRVEIADEHLGVDDHTIRVLHEDHPHWAGADVEIVVRTGDTCAGAPTPADAGFPHGVRAVLVAGGADAAAEVTVVPGLNEDVYDAPRHRVVSASSAEAACAAALLAPLHRGLGVVEALVTTVGGRTAPITDPTDPHLVRDAAVNIVPTADRVGADIGALLPELRERIDGLALRVPTVDAALVDVTARLSAPATPGQVRRCLTTASEGALKALLDCTREPLVSRDVVGETASCLADLGLIRTRGELVSVIGWYDPEAGHVHRVADLLGIMARTLPGR
ncbi:type I glyceraldehyde-3-phosphate dehydrogenase [Pseudonocardia sp. RS11V-5]|uniref:glyceraldehyde 3-phosphate dehydrogenase NAD-binding domain-containing protein n=1 Tax=Pseudonocardia terrae TaxID=2905831 RepID=UPI001E5BFD8F|nr:glyceraldehyde 3-phosphate dehydrogenase NAD-binding domain-containing protein [Pseudonocardia terrae]MCE3553140.1 type I glyceraldehyde-3-phosphate dehydrogenase [Pseudonocardia terrae]